MLFAVCRLLLVVCSALSVAFCLLFAAWMVLFVVCRCLMCVAVFVCFFFLLLRAACWLAVVAVVGGCLLFGVCCFGVSCCSLWLAVCCLLCAV